MTSEKSARIIVVVNQKGGVGKTTTAINLASFLSEEGQKVLLVDLDPQANATSGVGMDQSQIGKNVYHLLIDDQDIEDVLYPTAFENLHIIPSSSDLAGAEIEMVDIVSRETLLRRRMEVFREFYDYVIIDCPPSLGLLTLNALVAADRALIPAQCEYFALEGIAGLLKTLAQIKESLNPRLEIAGIVLTMYDRRTSLNRQVIENAKKHFRELVFETVIPRNIRLTEAPSHGLPIALYNPKSKGAEAYCSLAKEVIQRV